MCTRPLYVKQGITFDDRWVADHPHDLTSTDARVNFIVPEEEEQGVLPQNAEEQPEEGPQNAEALPEEGLQNAEARQEVLPQSVEAQPEPPRNNQEALAEDNWDEVGNAGDFGGEVSMVQDLNELNVSVQYAPGEGKTPVGLLRDPLAEYLSFPSLYVGEEPNLPPKTTYAAQCKYEISHYDTRFSRATHNLLFKVQRLTMVKLCNAIGIAMRQGTRRGTVTAKQLLNNVEVDSFIMNDVGKCFDSVFQFFSLLTIAIIGFRIVKTLRHSPAFWEAKMKDGMAMIRQLGQPTFFLTLSAAESHWTPLLLILYKVAHPEDSEAKAKEEVAKLGPEGKAEMIRNDPVTVATYFAHRTGKTMAFLKTDSSPLAPFKVVDSIVRVEFQHRGSPHIHCLLWTRNSDASATGPPQYRPYDSASEAECVAFIDQYMTCSSTALPSEFADLIKLQQHKHTFSCKRVKNGKQTCRFGFPQFPMEETRILDPFKENETANIEVEKKNLSTIITRLRELWEQTRRAPITISFADLLNELKLSKEEYVNAIRRSLKNSKVFLARTPGEININAYNPKILELHQANMDIQFVLDPYACVTYILSYITKANRGMSKLMREVVDDINTRGNISHREKLKEIAKKFLNASEISAQEAVYYILQMPVSMSSRHVSLFFIIK